MTEQPSIFPFGIRIDEPVTMATDVLVGVTCLVCAWKLKSLYNGSRMHRQILLYFFLMGVATLLGGIIGHGFLYALGFFWKLPGWLLSMIAVNLLERVMIHFSATRLSPQMLRLFSVFNIIELLAFMTLAFGTLNFLYVQIHSTYGFLVVVFSFCVYNYRKNNHPEAMKDLMIGVGWIFVCAVVFVARLGISRWFNHADLAHMFMFIGAIYFYRGSRGLMRSGRCVQRPGHIK
ncbi:hypothetical protein [Leadbetterella sp. DM7]|uniref:DUF6962 family protein n=1 Tax=Leadbetterella sp. DM7 TaxID=3235085 RepID=UPI00349E87F1